MKKIRFAFLSFALAALTSTAMAEPATQAKAPFPHHRTITVIGQGEVVTRPDVAEIQIAVEAATENAGKAMELANEKAKNIIKAAANQGVDAADVSTGTVSLSKVFRTAKEGEKGVKTNEGDSVEKIAGYRATLSSRIMVRKIETVGDLLDEMVKAGAARLTGIRFLVSNRNEQINKARLLAIKDAKISADMMAKESGGVLGAVMTIEDTGSILPKSRMMEMANESVGVPVMPGELEVVATVRAVFDLKKAP